MPIINSAVRARPGTSFVRMNSSIAIPIRYGPISPSPEVTATSTTVPIKAHFWYFRYPQMRSNVPRVSLARSLGRIK